MGKRSCHHCGIEDTALWRKGPYKKSILCNACGTRWRLKGTLVGYIPKHGLSDMERLAAKAYVKGLPLSIKVPRRKRSVLPQYCLTHIGRFHRQLLQLLHEPQSTEKTSAAGEEENDLLNYNTNWMTSTSNETTLGAVLLKK